MKTIFWTLIVMFFTLLSCTHQKDLRKKPEDQLIAEISGNKQLTEIDQSREPITSNENYLHILKIKYPTAVNIDTISRMFTYEFQEMLKKSSNMAFIKSGRVVDIEEYKGYHLITIERRNVIGRFIINSKLWPKFINDKSLLQGRTRRGFVVNISSIITIHSETNINIDDFSIPLDDETLSEGDYINISGGDLQDYVHLSFETSYRPSYIFYGTLVE